MPDPTEFRPPCPPIECDVCRRNLDRAKAEHWESTGLHFGLPPTRYGVLLVRVKCHGEQQDIAATFDWLRDNPGKPIIAFPDNPCDYGLRLMVGRDGFALPTNLKGCVHQLTFTAAIDPAEEGKDTTVLSVIHRRWPHLDERFLDWMENEFASAKGELLREIDPHAMVTANAIKKNAINLVDIVKKSMSNPIPTGKVSRLSAQIACMLMMLNEKIGTPRTRPKEWINDALPNVAEDERKKFLK